MARSAWRTMLRKGKTYSQTNIAAAADLTQDVDLKKLIHEAMLGHWQATMEYYRLLPWMKQASKV